MGIKQRAPSKKGKKTRGCFYGITELRGQSGSIKEFRNSSKVPVGCFFSSLSNILELYVQNCLSVDKANESPCCWHDDIRQHCLSTGDGDARTRARGPALFPLAFIAAP